MARQSRIDFPPILLTRQHVIHIFLKHTHRTNIIHQKKAINPTIPQFVHRSNLITASNASNTCPPSRAHLTKAVSKSAALLYVQRPINGRNRICPVIYDRHALAGGQPRTSFISKPKTFYSLRRKATWPRASFTRVHLRAVAVSVSFEKVGYFDGNLGESNDALVRSAIGQWKTVDVIESRKKELERSAPPSVRPVAVDRRRRFDESLELRILDFCVVFLLNVEFHSYRICIEFPCNVFFYHSIDLS